MKTPGGKKKILVLRYRFIGDTILAVPFFRNLRCAEPDAHIAWVVAPGSSDVIAGIPYVDELIYWDPVTIHADSRGTHRTLRSKIAFLRELRARQFDKVYVLKRSLSSALMAFATGAPRRIGFDTEGRGLLLTTRVPYRHDQHEVQNFLDVLRADGVPVIDDHLEAWLTDEERRTAGRFLDNAGVRAGVPLVAIHPFAANPKRAWHLDNFIELAERVQTELGARVVVFGGGRDRESIGPINAALSSPPIFAIGSTTIRETMALLARCAFLICNDSGIMHLAAALRVPLLALFGPQSPVKFGPWGESCWVVSARFSCSPCRQKFFSECEPSPRMSPECLEKIAVEDVFRQLEGLLPRRREST